MMKYEQKIVRETVVNLRDKGGHFCALTVNYSSENNVFTCASRVYLTGVIFYFRNVDFDGC